MPEFDFDFVPCNCKTTRNRLFVEVRPTEYTDGHGPMHRGTRLARALCCGLEFAIIPPGRVKLGSQAWPGYVEVEPVRVKSGEIVRRLAIKAGSSSVNPWWLDLESLPDCGCGPAPNPRWQTDTLKQALARPLLVSHEPECAGPAVPAARARFLRVLGTRQAYLDDLLVEHGIIEAGDHMLVPETTGAPTKVGASTESLAAGS